MENTNQIYNHQLSSQSLTCYTCQTKQEQEVTLTMIQNCGHLICFDCLEQIAAEKQQRCCNNLRIDWQVQQETMSRQFVKRLLNNGDQMISQGPRLNQSPQRLQQQKFRQTQATQIPSGEKLLPGQASIFQLQYKAFDIAEDINLLQLEIEAEKIQFLQQIELRMQNIEKMLLNQRDLEQQCKQQIKDNQNNQDQNQNLQELLRQIKEINLNFNSQETLKYSKATQENENLQIQNQRLKEELELKTEKIEKYKLNIQNKKEQIQSLEQGLNDMKEEMEKQRQIQQELTMISQKEGSQMNFYKQQIEHLNSLIQEKQKYILFLENKVEEKSQKISEKKQEVEKIEKQLKKIKQKELNYEHQFKNINSQEESIRQLQEENENLILKLQNSEKLITEAENQTYQLKLQINKLSQSNEELGLYNKNLQQNLDSNDDKLRFSSTQKEQNFIQMKQKNKSLKDQIDILLSQIQNCTCLKLKEEINDFYEFLIHLMEKVSNYNSKKGTTSNLVPSDYLYLADKSIPISYSQRSASSSRKIRNNTLNLKDQLSQSFSTVKSSKLRQREQNSQYVNQSQNETQEIQDFVMCFYKMKRIVLQLIQFSAFNDKVEWFSEFQSFNKTRSIYSNNFYSDRNMESFNEEL